MNFKSAVIPLFFYFEIFFRDKSPDKVTFSLRHVCKTIHIYRYILGIRVRKIVLLYF